MMPATGTTSKREITKPLASRVDILEDKAEELKKGLDECQDVKGKMDVLDERTKTLIKQAAENKIAIFGTSIESPGILTRLKSLEDKLEEVKQFIGDTKKLGYGVLIAALGIFIELLVQLILSHGSALAK